jgi:Heavy metal binding domain
MEASPRPRQLAAPFIYMLAAACSSRSLPSTWPDSAAASPSAAAAPAADVTRSLESEPPLPGESMSGWAGLAAPAADHAEHEHGVTYTCPMHPDVVSEGPGQCPRCGMNLVKRDAPK